jgi:hypothetical protein
MHTFFTAKLFVDPPLFVDVRWRNDFGVLWCPSANRPQLAVNYPLKTLGGLSKP